MSKMSDVNIELTELGYAIVYEAENQADELMKKFSHQYVIKYLSDTFHISADTAIMIIGGRKTRHCSNTLLDLDET